jgi:hypothetical protein
MIWTRVRLSQRSGLLGHTAVRIAWHRPNRGTLEGDDFLAIDDVLREICARIGRFYMRRIDADGSERLLPPRERVTAEIEALERYTCRCSTAACTTTPSKKCMVY